MMRRGNAQPLRRRASDPPAGLLHEPYVGIDLSHVRFGGGGSGDTVFVVEGDLSVAQAAGIEGGDVEADLLFHRVMGMPRALRGGDGKDQEHDPTKRSACGRVHMGKTWLSRRYDVAGSVSAGKGKGSRSGSGCRRR